MSVPNQPRAYRYDEAEKSKLIEECLKSGLSVEAKECAGLPDHATLKKALISARNEANGGLNLDMWAKANPKMRKALLRVVVDKLIFKEGQAQIFYRQINQGSDDGKSKNKIVNLSEKRESTKMNVKHQSQASVEASGDAFHMSLELFRKSSHNPMDQGWYIGKNGCGSRI